MITPIILSALQKNQSLPDFNKSSGTITPETYSMIPNILNINPKNIPVAISCDIAAMINIRRVGTYRWIIPSGISIPNAIRFANPRKNPTKAIFCSKKVKKKITEK